VPGWAVPRPRMTKLIAEGRRWCPLTVVIGPPGAGKTMALALWAAAEPGPVAWVGLDDYDNRPRVFWSYLVAALRRSGVAVPGALPAAARGRPADHVFLLRLASAMAAQDPPVTLVVEDLYVLTDPRVLDGLDYLLRDAASWPRSGPATWRSAPPRPACSWPGMASRCRRTRWSASPGGQRAGRPASASPRSPWTPIPTPTNSSRSWLRRTAP